MKCIAQRKHMYTKNGKGARMATHPSHPSPGLALASMANYYKNIFGGFEVGFST